MDKRFLAEDQFKSILAKTNAVNINVDIVGLIATNQFTEAKLAAAELSDQLDTLEKMANQKKQSDRSNFHMDHMNKSFRMLVPK